MAGTEPGLSWRVQVEGDGRWFGFGSTPEEALEDFFAKIKARADSMLQDAQRVDEQYERARRLYARG